MRKSTLNKVYGYVRVSTKEQNPGRQVDELTKFCDSGNIYMDKLSGKNFDRPEYQKLKNELLRAGDELYIKSLDRLGRDKRETKKELEEFKAKGIIVRVLDVPTTLMDFSQFGDLQAGIMDMINNVLIEVLGTIAEQELKTIRRRQAGGIATWRKTGITKTGRPYGRPTVQKIDDDFKAVYTAWRAKTIPTKEAYEKLKMSRATFYRVVKTYEKESV